MVTINRKEFAQGYVRLNPRPRVVHWLLVGAVDRKALSNPQIADHMGLSLGGVSKHVSILLKELGVPSRCEIIKFSCLWGIVVPLPSLRDRARAVFHRDFNSLSRERQEVMRLLFGPVDGPCRSNKEIAEVIGIDVPAVEAHIQAILARLAERDRENLIRLMALLGLPPEQ